MAVAFQVVRKKGFSVTLQTRFSNNYSRLLPSQPHPQRKIGEKRGGGQIQTEDTSFRDSLQTYSQPGLCKLPSWKIPCLSSYENS